MNRLAGLLLAAAAVTLPLGLNRGAARLDTEGSSTDCADCHAEVVEAWSGSRHAAARTNLAFVEALKTADNAGWCLNCHAPVAAQADEGITCAVCHVREGRVLSAKEPGPDAVDAHPMRVEPSLSGSRLCAGCHEFRAPDVHDRLDQGGALQSTFSEWLAWEGDEDCASCHLDGHRFSGRELMADTVFVQIEDDTLVVSLVGEVGHAVPTGDPFRRLELRACMDEGCETVLGRQSFTRLHTFDERTWWPSTDHRLGPVGTGLPQQRSWTPPLEAGFWELRYLLVSPRDAPALPDDEVFISLQAGTWPAPPGR